MMDRWCKIWLDRVKVGGYVPGVLEPDESGSRLVHVRWLLFTWRGLAVTRPSLENA